MRSFYLSLMVAAAAVSAAWFLVFTPRLELANTKLSQTTERLEEARQLDEQRVSTIQAQADQLALVLIAEKQNRETLALIARQGQAQARALQELKNHDQEIADYLRLAVPADIGRLYQRTETADPSAYRQPPQVPINSLPAASQSGTDNK